MLNQSTKANRPYKFLPWDSNFFGFDVGICHVKEANTESVVSMLSAMRKDGMKLAYLSSPFKLDIDFSFLTDIGGQLVDVKTTYQKSLQSLRNDRSYNEVKAFEGKVPSEKLVSLSIQSGAFSRFKIDENISNKKFKELYSLMIANSVNKSIAHDVFIYEEDNEITGVVTIKYEGEVGKIGIIAVDTDQRGKGIGKKLMESSEFYLWSNQCLQVEVITQDSNRLACKFYESCGYQIKSVEYFYHFWL